MAFNPTVFKQRTLTAIVFAAIMAAGLLWNAWSFFALFSIVHFGCWIEYTRLIEKTHPAYAGMLPVQRWAWMLLGWGAMLWATDYFLYIGAFYLSEAGGYLAFASAGVVLISLLFRKPPAVQLNASAAGLLYISLPLALMVWLRCHYRGAEAHLGFTLPVLIVLTNWINDTGAYIVGSLLGKTPFSKISPNKTWEGTVGGVFFAVGVMALLAHLTGRLHPAHAAVMAGLGAVAGTAGDLFQSWLKRRAGVKDSGTLMPGHGGFLDRFDSLLFCAVVVWAYAVLVL